MCTRSRTRCRSFQMFPSSLPPLPWEVGWPASIPPLGPRPLKSVVPYWLLQHRSAPPTQAGGRGRRGWLPPLLCVLQDGGLTTEGLGRCSACGVIVKATVQCFISLLSFCFIKYYHLEWICIINYKYALKRLQVIVWRVYVSPPLLSTFWSLIISFIHFSLWAWSGAQALE